MHAYALSYMYSWYSCLATATATGSISDSQAHIWAKESCVPGLASGNGYTAPAKGCDVIQLIKGCGLTVFTSGPVSRCLHVPGFWGELLSVGGGGGGALTV